MVSIPGFFTKKKNSTPLSPTSGGSVAKQIAQALISNSVISNPLISIVSLPNIPDIPPGFEGHHKSCGQQFRHFHGVEQNLEKSDFVEGNHTEENIAIVATSTLHTLISIDGEVHVSRTPSS